MSLGENSLVAAYQGRGQLKSRPSGTKVVTFIVLFTIINHCLFTVTILLFLLAVYMKSCKTTGLVDAATVVCTEVEQGYKLLYCPDCSTPLHPGGE